MYLFTTMSYPHNTRIDQSKTHVILKEALKDFTSPIVVEVRERMRSAEKVIWRPFENTLVPSPWYRGRVVLIGAPCCAHHDASSDRRWRDGD